MKIQFDKKLLNKIKKRHNLSLIILHGSQVEGKIHPRSDIDLAVVRNNHRQKLRLLKLIKDLSNLFEPEKIDVSDLTNADPLLLYSATRKSILLAGDKKDFDQLLKLAFHKYSDYLPYLEKENKFIKERVDEYATS